MKDRHLGGRVYVRYGVFGVILYLYNGDEEYNHISLDASTLRNFIQFVKDMIEELKKPIE